MHQINTKSCRSDGVILSTIDHSQRLNLICRSLVARPDSSLKLVYDINKGTLMSPTPFKSNLKSSAVRPSNEFSGITSNTPDLNA